MFPWTGCEPSSRDVNDFVGNARKRRRRIFAARSLGAALFVVLFLAPALAAADESWTPLVRRLVADGFDKPAMDALFYRPELRFDPQVMARKVNALLAARLAAPRPRTEEPEIYLRYLNPFLLMRAQSFRDDHSEVLGRAELRYGVPEEVLVALLLVESKLGRTMGTKSALVTLASMALSSDFALIAPFVDRGAPPRLALWLRWRTAAKAAWAYRELKALLVYSRNLGADPAGIPGSAYGAIGLCQFMPSNALRYGVDASGRGRVNLFDPADAILSAANFLAANGWNRAVDDDGRMRVLYRYNHSRPYARTILAVADSLRDFGPRSGSDD